MSANITPNMNMNAEHRHSELIDAIERDCSVAESNQLPTSPRQTQVSSPSPVLHREPVYYDSDSDDGEFEDLFTYAPKRIRPYKSETLLSPGLLSQLSDVPMSMPAGQHANLDNDGASVKSDRTLVRFSADDSAIVGRHRRCATVDSASTVVNDPAASLTMNAIVNTTASKDNSKRSMVAFPADSTYDSVPLKRSASLKRVCSLLHAEPVVNAITRFRKESSRASSDGSPVKVTPTPTPSNERRFGGVFGSLHGMRSLTTLRKPAGAAHQ